MAWDAEKFAASSSLLAPAAPQPLWSADKFATTVKERLGAVDQSLAASLFDDDASQQQRVQQIANQYGLDPALVKPNLTEFEAMDLARRVGTAPTGVQRYLRDPNNSALIPMVDELSGIGRVLQNLVEVPKGIPEGAIRTVGTAATGAAAMSFRQIAGFREAYDELLRVPDMLPGDIQALREAAPGRMPSAAVVWYNRAIDAIVNGDMAPEEAVATFGLGSLDTDATLQDEPFFKAGEWLQRNADLFPAREGFEDSVGRQLGTGLGSVASGIAVSTLTTPVGGGAFFALAGSGEAVERAIAAGATEDQILKAAQLGYIPGLTDSLPIETLLGRIPVPGGKYIKVPAGLLGSALKAIGRIGWQAFVEGVQEGGQRFLQNLIAQQVYDPAADLAEGVVPEAGIGGGVGALSEVARLMLSGFAGRYGGGRLQIDRTPTPQPEEQTAASVQQAIEAVQSSKLVAADPARMRALIDSIAPEGTVYIPVAEVQRLHQEGKITDATLAQWGVARQLEEATASGGDVVIPARDFLTAPMPAGAAAEVARHVRLQPEARTANEAEIDRERYEAEIEALMQRLGEVEDRQEQGNIVFETIRKELVAAGRSEREAEAQATLWRERYLLRASQREIGDADALFMRDRVGIVGPRVGAETRAAAAGNLDLVIARLKSGREVNVPQRPLIDELKARGGVEPGSPLAKELEALGITPKTARSLFRKGGLRAADNIPVGEVPVLRDSGIARDANDYVDERALIDALGEEFAGRPLLTEEDRARIDMLDAPVAELRAMLDAAGIDYQTASPETLRAFLETALRSEPETGTPEISLDAPDDTGGRRGAFERQRDKYGNIANVIRLTRNADRSTFLHETGHFWLFQLVEDSFDASVRPEVRERLRADLATVLKWFGVKADLETATPADVLAAIQTEHHEKWARGTEAYFMEGKAPSVALRDVFTRFAGWLRRIYAKLAALDVPLTDDVRAVMDRLLATDQAIEDARGANLYKVPAELLESLTPAERASIEKLAEEAGAEAWHTLHSRIVRQMERDTRAEIKAERARVTDEATLEVRRRPVYAALNLLRDGQTATGETLVDDDGKARVFKLDRAELKARYGEEIVGLLPGGIFAKRGELSIRLDAFAAMAGFKSGDELRLALQGVKDQPEAAAIRSAVDAEMARRHGDVMSEIDRTAAEVVANDKQVQLMALQARYLRRMAGEAMRKAAERGVRQKGAGTAEADRARVAGAASDTERVIAAVGTAEAAATAQIGEEMARATAAAGPAQRQAQRAAGSMVRGIRDTLDAGLMRDAAKRFVRSRRVRDLGSPAAIEQRIARKTREIEQAIATRDYEAAAVLMEQRLFNLFLAREVRAALEESAKARAYLATFDRKATRQRIGRAEGGFLEQIDALLEKYEFRPQTKAASEQWTALGEWLQQVSAEGIAVEIPEEVRNRAARVNFHDIPYGELLALRDAVKSIAHAAGLRNKMLREAEKRTLNELVDEGVASIEAHTEPRPVQINPQRQTVRNRMTRAFSGYFALVTKARTWLETLDGFERGRFFDRTMLKPIRDAEVSLLKRKDAEAGRLRELIASHRGRLGERVHVPAIGESMTLEERLALALNWGNESSREAVLEDRQRRWSREQVDAILDTLTADDWRLVQSIWDYVDTFWPEIAALHRKRTGLAPEKVEASPVATRHGIFRGGYYPLAYDSEMSSRTRENTIEQEFEGMNAGRYAAAATRRGHTKERVGSGGQSVRLALDVLPRHVNQVLTDLEMGPAVSDVWKLLTHPRMKASIEEALGVEAVTQLDMWIKDAAVGQTMAGDALSRAFRGLRTSVSAGAMGWKLATSLVQLTGYSQTVVEIGPKWALAGLAKFAANPAAAARQVQAASPFMATRGQSFLRDVADALADARGKGLRGRVMRTLFFPIAKMQLMVDIPTWLGALQKAQAQNHPDPVAFADATVEASQSSGLMSVLSPVERGTVTQGVRLSEFVKLWTAFYSYFNAKLNVAMRRTRATDFRKPGEIAHLAADYLMLFWVEAALGDAILRVLPDWLGGEGDDDEEKDFAAGVMFQMELTLMNAAATLPLVRETASALRGFDAAPSATRGLGDVSRGLREIGQFAGAVVSEDEDIEWGQLIRSLVSAGNVVSPVKYPASQINVALKAMEDEDATWIDYLLAEPRR